MIMTVDRTVLSTSWSGQLTKLLLTSALQYYQKAARVLVRLFGEVLYL